MELNLNDTLTGICNSALALVGHADFIADIDEDTSTAKTLRMVLVQVCREVQTHESGAWNELEKEVALVRKGSLPGSMYEWNIPTDTISIVSCFKMVEGINGERRVRVPYQIIGGMLRCEEDSGVFVRFIRFSLEPSEWSTELKTCVIKLLSARILSALAKDYAGAHKLEQNFWAIDFPYWAGNRKNKACRSDGVGNDQALTQFYY